MEYDVLNFNQGNYEMTIYSPDKQEKIEIEIGHKDFPESYNGFNITADEAAKLIDFLNKHIK